MSLSYIRELSVKFTRNELTQKEVQACLELFFATTNKIPAEGLLQELLDNAELLTESIKKLTPHL